MPNSRPGLQSSLAIPIFKSPHFASASSLLQRSLPSLASVIGGEFLLRIANFLVLLLIARLYGAPVLGLYAAALAYATLAVTAAENGLQVGAITEINRQPSEISKIVSQLYGAKTIVFLSLFLILALIGSLVRLSVETWIVGGLLTFRTSIQSYCQLQLAILKSINRMLSIGVIQSIHFVALLAGIAASHHYSWTFHILLWWLVGCQSFELILEAGWLWRVGIHPRGFTIAECLKLLWRYSPAGLTLLMAGIIVRMDVIVISLLVPIAEVGHFAAAQSVIVVIYVISWLFGSVVLPDMVRLATNEKSLEQYIHQWTRLFLWTTVPISAALFWLAPPIMSMLFGNSYAQSGHLTSVMLLAIPCIVLNSLQTNRAIALRRPSIYMGTYLMAVVIAIALDLLFGRAFASIGIAVAIVIREISMFAIFKVRFHSASSQVVRLEEVPARLR